jgi:hypothetical protein
MTPAREVSAILLGLAFFGCAHAADLYRWVDDKGRVHFSDTVPAEYRNTARKIAAEADVPPERRKEAEERAAREIERARAAAAAATKATEPPAPDLAAPPPPRPVADPNDCKALHRAYKNAQDCFGPYVTVNGAVKAEAYERCPVLPDPSQRCGPAPNWDREQ